MNFKKLSILFTTVLFTVLTAPSVVGAGYDDQLPNASCENGVLKVYINSKGTSSRTAVRIDNLSNGFVQPGDVVENNFNGSAYVFDNAVVGDWYAWWFHRVDEKGVYGPSQGGYLQCEINRPMNLSHTYSYPYVTLKWEPVKGAKYYAIRVDNAATAWSGDKDNIFSGDHLRDQLTGTTFKFQAAKGSKINWWIHAIDSKGNYSKSSGQTFVNPN